MFDKSYDYMTREREEVNDNEINNKEEIMDILLQNN